MKYVIIGNSAAAVGCIEGIRLMDKTGDIAVISDEPYHVYSRPLISYLLQGKTDEQRMRYRGDEFYRENGCTCLFGKTAKKIDRDAKKVFLSDGEAVEYDKLLVAVGSSPFVPPMEGIDTVPKRFPFMKLDDARALAEALTPEKRVLIIGGGLIGLKCAEGILDRCCSIDVVDLSERILSSILDSTGAAMVQKHLESVGMSFHLGTSVERFDGNTAYLKNGERLEFDVLVTAVGVKPNTALVSEAGGGVKRGIVVDDHMRTDIPDVYAAGDCAEMYDISAGTSRILAILPNAYHGGNVAGVNMAGGDAAITDAMPMNAIGFFGLHIITAGTYEGSAYEYSDGESYKKLFYSGDRLHGYILVGNVDRAGIYTSLIREETPLSDVDFDMICRDPGLIAFSRSYRDEKLGGHKNVD